MVRQTEGPVSEHIRAMQFVLCVETNKRDIRMTFAHIEDFAAAWNKLSAELDGPATLTMGKEKRS